MKKPGTFAVLFVMALALSATAAFAQSPASTSGTDGAKHMARGEHRERGEHRHGHDQRGMKGFQFRKLNLTDAQKAEMKQIRENHQATISGLRQQMGIKHKELREAEKGGNFNEALATQKLSEMAPLQAKLMAERLAVRQESMKVLTAEQKAQLNQTRTEWKAKRAAHRDSQQ